MLLRVSLGVLLSLVSLWWYYQERLGFNSLIKTSGQFSSLVCYDNRLSYPLSVSVGMHNHKIFSPFIGFFYNIGQLILEPSATQLSHRCVRYLVMTFRYNSRRNMLSNIVVETILILCFFSISLIFYYAYIHKVIFSNQSLKRYYTE